MNLGPPSESSTHSNCLFALPELLRIHILQRNALAHSIGKPSHFHAHLSIGNNNKPSHFESLQEILHAIQCTVVFAVRNRFIDSYVLSESSLFVYLSKIIIKTCETTQLLKSIHPLLNQALNLILSISFCKFTRGNFIFPKSQPFPHTGFKEEVIYLENSSVMPSKIASHSWHIFTAANKVDLGMNMINHNILEDFYTIEICMTESGYTEEIARKKMTEIIRIGNINLNALICDFGFDPCNYSMNRIDGYSLQQNLKRTQMVCWYWKRVCCSRAICVSNFLFFIFCF
ncbi:hypothetical protein UlMin_026741 [Ulmus minor]